jgi:hypothetical protein
LLTNNHVLGDTVCPIEGCFIEISVFYQRGQPRGDSMTVFAVPTAVDVGMDMAVVQLYALPVETPLATPNYLSLYPIGPSELIGKHVTVVGHPRGRLKKWTDGYVIDASGEWFTSTNYSLPGNSGSPVLDDEGRIVGLLHRVPTSEDLFSEDGANVYSIGTASEPIRSALNAPLPKSMISVTASTTQEAFVSNDRIYRNARVESVVVDNVSTDALSVLGQACDAALARKDFISPDDLTAALTPCYHAYAWIECRSDSSSNPGDALCPSNTSDWASRYVAINQHWESMNGSMDYYSLSYAIARLQMTQKDGVSAGSKALQQAIGAVNPKLDFVQLITSQPLALIPTMV